MVRPGLCNRQRLGCVCVQPDEHEGKHKCHCGRVWFHPTIQKKTKQP